MKKIVLFVLVIAAAVATAPWLTGQMIEKRYHAMIKQLSDESALQITEADYRRGWLTSEATSRITFPVKNGKTETLLVHHHIHHGLLMLDKDAPYIGLGLIRHEIELPANVQARLKKDFGSAEPLRMITRLALNGDQQWKIESEPLHLHQTAKDVQIHPARLSMVINAGQNEITGSLNWAGLQAKTDKGDGEIAPLQWNFDMQRIRPFVWTGDSDWQQGIISFNQRNKYILVSGLKLTSHTTTDGQQRLSNEQHLLLDEFNVSGAHFGPGKLDVAIRHIPHSSIENFGHIQQQAASLSTQGNPEAAKMAMQQLGMQLLGEVPALIAAEPVIEIPELSLQTPAGEIKGSFHFSVSGVDANNAMNLPLLKQHSHLKLELQVPSALLSEQSREQLMTMMQRGLIRSEGDMLVIHASLENGTLVINDQQVPLPF